MGITNYIESQYKAILEKRYNKFKASMEEENFVPDATEVWKMYKEMYQENHGIYIFAAELLELEPLDDSGRLNELVRALDKINDMTRDYCTAYVMGLQKNGKNK